MLKSVDKVSSIDEGEENDLSRIMVVVACLVETKEVHINGTSPYSNDRLLPKRV